ncbi:MAG TPA: hypothetical protein VLA04_05410, partial [Verrucomicrobiae bacterium]|nr:hypothetical protein [Verrucomicrobiae bacterium]
MVLLERGTKALQHLVAPKLWQLEILVALLRCLYLLVGWRVAPGRQLARRSRCRQYLTCTRLDLFQN